ncbi:MAG: gamma-glutamyl-gamma-aminobutyrate hydrolase family protein [Clostridia bacterium]|nr:gamma-glutamyl-gamma-aminobutyrate hydrolase family protein [Clostridia bacterium]
MKPIIGIIGRPHKTNTDKNIICTFEDYRNAVCKFGGIPISILPTQILDYDDIRPAEIQKMTKSEIEDLKTQIDLCDGIIFPGGGRIYQYAYEIYDYIYEKDIPCLGTCLGMQTIACAMEKRNSSKILSKIESNIEHKQMDTKFVHFVNIVKDSKLYAILEKDRIQVNSKHTYCINNVNNVNISAYSEDGIIEAIEIENKKFILGVQWHPEELLDENMERIIKAFIQNSQK